MRGQDAARRQGALRGLTGTVQSSSGTAPRRVAEVYAALDASDKLELQGAGEDLAPVLRALPSRGVTRALDVGCGSGVLTRALAHHWRGRATIWGMDRSPAQVRRARQLARQDGCAKVRFIAGDIFGPPSRLEQAFDLVLCRYFLMYMLPAGRGAECLRRMASLVRPGGHVVCIEADVNFGEERHPPAPQPLASVLPRVVDYYRRAGLIEWRCGPRLFQEILAARLAEPTIRVVDGRIVQGGRPTALVAHDGWGVERLLTPVLGAMGMSGCVADVAAQWRAYLADTTHFLFTPIFVATTVVR